MTKIIKIQDYLLESDIPELADLMPKDNQHDLSFANQQLLSEVMNLEGNLYSQSLVSAALKKQVMELQVENDTLISALEDSNEYEEEQEEAVMLTDVVTVSSQEDVASQSAYWEREYCELKDKIRCLEQSLSEQGHALKQANQQNEQLLNELLAK